MKWIHNWKINNLYVHTYRIIIYILDIYIYIYAWTVLEPHNFRSLWIFGCGPKNHFWARSDGFNDTILLSKSWSLASFLRHFGSYFWSFPNKISNCSIPPPLTLEYLGGVRQEISEKYCAWPREIYCTPPRVFLVSKKRGGGPPDATF